MSVGQTVCQFLVSPSCQLNETFLQIIGNYFETASYTLMCDNDVEKGLGKCKCLL